MSSRFIQVFLLAMASLATIFSTDIFLPSLPSLASYFGTSEDATQLTIPICLLGSLLGAPFLGMLSDFFPRKRVMLIGLGIFLIGTALCIIAYSLPFLLLGRFIQGFGAIVSTVVGYVMVQDLYPKDESAKAMSWMGSIISVAPLIAPGLGGYIHVTFGWQGNFVLLFLCAALTSLLIFFLSPSSLPPQKEKLSSFNTLKIYGEIITNKKFIYYISFFSLLLCAEWCYLTIIPFYFENKLHLSPDIFGLYLAGSASFYLLGTSFTPFILNHFGTMKTLAIGIFICLAGSVFLFIISIFFASFPLLIALAVGFYFFGTAVIWAPSISKALQCFENTRGAASAVRSLVITTACALGGVIGSFLDDSSIVTLSLFLLMMAIGCGAIFLKVQKL